MHPLQRGHVQPLWRLQQQRRLPALPVLPLFRRHRPRQLHRKRERQRIVVSVGQRERNWQPRAFLLALCQRRRDRQPRLFILVDRVRHPLRKPAGVSQRDRHLLWQLDGDRFGADDRHLLALRVGHHFLF